MLAAKLSTPPFTDPLALAPRVGMKHNIEQIYSSRTFFVQYSVLRRVSPQPTGLLAGDKSGLHLQQQICDLGECNQL